MTTYKMTSNIIVPNLILILNFNSSGDIITGDQNITNHDNLRKIISHGPNFKELEQPNIVRVDKISLIQNTTSNSQTKSLCECRTKINLWT